MKHTQQPEALLVLQDGSVYKGFALGKRGTSGGEICFNTGMTGYQEIYTDPSYYGQVVINTTSHIGNYGVQHHAEEESSGVKIRGMVCNFFSQIHSRYTADGSLQDYFEQANIVGIHGIDTRQLVRYIRDKGVMNCIISSEILVERPTQRAILLGEGGRMIKKTGIMAREELERFFNKKVFLETFVKVEPDWRNKERALKRFGYDD